MKQALSILLILLYFSDAVAPPAVFAIIKSKAEREAKRSIERGVPENALYKLIEDSRDYSKAFWIKPGKEFKLRGAFYDVVRVSRINGKKTYYCLNDIREKSLFKRFASIINGEVSNTLAKNKLARQIFKKLIGYRIYLPYALRTEKIVFTNSFDRAERTLEQDSPPPVPPPRSY